RRLLARSRFHGHDGPVLLSRYVRTPHARLTLHICAHSRGAIITTLRATGQEVSTFPVIQATKQARILSARNLLTATPVRRKSPPSRANARRANEIAGISITRRRGGSAAGGRPRGCAAGSPRPRCSRV